MCTKSAPEYRSRPPTVVTRVLGQMRAHARMDRITYATRALVCAVAVWGPVALSSSQDLDDLDLDGSGSWSGGGGGYKLLRAHVGGRSFFNDFDFITAQDPTHGAVQFLDRKAAEKLITYPGKNRVKWGVDHTTKHPAGIHKTPSGKFDGSGYTNRDAVRVMGKQVYDVGADKPLKSLLIMIDLEHMPTGCGVWPSFWTTYPDYKAPATRGTNTVPVWPTLGEIDIIEAWGTDNNTLTSLHTTDVGCEKWTPPRPASAGKKCSTNPDLTPSVMSGSAEGSDNCGAGEGGPGCGIQGPLGSAGSAFNANRGGVFAMEWSAGQQSNVSDPDSQSPIERAMAKPVSGSVWPMCCSACAMNTWTA
eukprot:COSAG01_NODE_3285_length_6309_cov_2.105153_9_plen_361_part_00